MEVDIMNIREVLKKENVGKEYEVEGYTYEVVESFNGNLNLKNINTHSYIEYELTLVDIVNSEFEEYLDWSKVSVDAKVLVSDNGKLWYKRHFAKYENGSVHVFPDGRSSFTTEESDIIYPWKYAKLYEKQDKLKGWVYDDKRK